MVDNAIRDNLPEHGWITVTTDVVDDRAHLTVENTGLIVPPYEVPGIFEPFRRLSATERRTEVANTSSSRGAGAWPKRMMAASTLRLGQMEGLLFEYESL